MWNQEGYMPKLTKESPPPPPPPHPYPIGYPINLGNLGGEMNIVSLAGFPNSGRQYRGSRLTKALLAVRGDSGLYLHHPRPYQKTVYPESGISRASISWSRSVYRLVVPGIGRLAAFLMIRGWRMDSATLARNLPVRSGYTALRRFPRHMCADNPALTHDACHWVLAERAMPAVPSYYKLLHWTPFLP